MLGKQDIGKINELSMSIIGQVLDYLGLELLKTLVEVNQAIISLVV